MGKKLFVGNLAYGVTSEELQALFAEAGICESASVVTDRDTGQSRGFGFVMMGSPDDAERARKQLDGTELKGRKLRIDEAHDQTIPGSQRARRQSGRMPGGRSGRGFA